MEFARLIEIVGAEPVFETGLLLAGDVEPNHVRRQSSRWTRAGRLYQLRRGLYALAPPFQQVKPRPFVIANRMVRGSYVSCQSALAHYGLIPEYVPVVVSVTTGRPGRWTTPLGDFEFRHIKTDLFYGHRLIELGGGQKAFVAMPLYELGLSPHCDEVLAVKIEVDTNPPVGAMLTTTVIRRHVTLQLQHHDRASLLAGKLHAILQRSYIKGRDLYDLLWFLSDPSWPAPNLTMLNNALEQTGWTGDALTEANWRSAVRQRLETIPWEHVVTDARPFLEPSVDLDILTRENLMRVLK